MRPGADPQQPGADRTAPAQANPGQHEMRPPPSEPPDCNCTGRPGQLSDTCSPPVRVPAPPQDLHKALFNAPVTGTNRRAPPPRNSSQPSWWSIHTATFEARGLPPPASLIARRTPQPGRSGYERTPRGAGPEPWSTMRSRSRCPTKRRHVPTSETARVVEESQAHRPASG